MSLPTSELKDTKIVDDASIRSTDEDLKLAAARVEGQIEDLDEAGLFLQEHNFSRAYLSELLSDKALGKKVLRKTDLTLMPLLCGTYLLQYIDKQALSYSAVFDLFDTTNVSSNQYSWLASIFYFAYLFAEWPSSYLAQHYRTSLIIGCFIMSWGSILMITASCSNFTGLAICRFLLGCFESVVTPCFMLIVSSWYTKREQPARAGLFYCFNGVGSMMGGILFYCVGFEKNFPVWKVIFLLCGSVTIIWGLVLLRYMPDKVTTAKRFTPEERALVIARTHANRTGVYNSKIKFAQIKEALIDPQVWLLFLYVLFNETINGGLANFGKLIVKGVANGDSLLTTAYGIPQGAFQILFVFSGPFIASKIKNSRTIVMVVYLFPTIIGTTLMWKLPRSNTVGCLFAYYIVGSFVGSLVLALQLPASNVAGYTKRVTATAFVFLAYCIGNIIGPHAFLADEAPIYPTGCKLIIACAVGQIVTAIMLRILLIWRNKKRDAMVTGETEHELSETDRTEFFEDCTDFENLKFRYSY